MAVDLLRSCYSTDMRFFRDRPDIVTRVVWYWCEPDAKLLPFRTSFNSGNWWSDDTQDLPLGEVLGAPRPWYGGQPPAPYDGQTPCGNDRQFLEGEALPPEPPITRLANGMPVCCGGALEGGLLYYGGEGTSLIPNEVQIRRATTMDLYRTGTSPPAAPAIAGIPILIAADYRDIWYRTGGAEVAFQFTHTALVEAPLLDIRDAYNGGVWSFNNDLVWVPDKTSGTFFDVVFVEVIQLEGSAAVFQKVYLRRFRPTAFPGQA